MTETPPTATKAPRYRPVNFGVSRVNLREGANGTRYLQADLPLAAGAVGPAGGELVHLHWDRSAVHALGAG